MDLNQINDQMVHVLQKLVEELRTIFLANRTDETASCDVLVNSSAEVECWVTSAICPAGEYSHPLGYILSNQQLGLRFDWIQLFLTIPGSPDIYYLNQSSQPENREMDILCALLRRMEEFIGRRERPVFGSSNEVVYVLQHWWTTYSSKEFPVIYYLTNGVVQVDLDSAKIIMCTEKGVITYVDNKKDKRTFTFQTLQKKICCKELEKHLLQVYEIVANLFIEIQQKVGTSLEVHRRPSYVALSRGS